MLNQQQGGGFPPGAFQPPGHGALQGLSQYGLQPGMPGRAGGPLGGAAPGQPRYSGAAGGLGVAQPGYGGGPPGRGGMGGYGAASSTAGRPAAALLVPPPLPVTRPLDRSASTGLVSLGGAGGGGGLARTQSVQPVGRPPPAGFAPPARGPASGSDLLALLKQGGAGGLSAHDAAGGPLLAALLGEEGGYPPVPYDSSDFPSLASRPGSGSSLGLAAPPGSGDPEGRGDYALANAEEFPALGGGKGKLDGMYGSREGGPLGLDSEEGEYALAPRGGRRARPGLPAAERYGLLGLLSAIRKGDEPRQGELSLLALGTDLTSLGLNLNSAEPLSRTFASPWAEAPCRPQPDVPAPAAYLQQPPWLPPTLFTRFSIESLFFAFYSCPGEEAALAAAEELAQRGWLWHTELRAWLQRAPDAQRPPERLERGERGSYVLFDAAVWDYVRRDGYVLDYGLCLREFLRKGA